MVGKLGVEGIKPGMYVEPIRYNCRILNTTGPKQEMRLKNLLHYLFGADMVVQSFCHTAAPPKTS